MASRGNVQTANKLQKNVNRLTALFKGRINEKVAAELINEHGGLQQAAVFLMTGNSDDVRRRLQKSDEYLRSLREDSAKFTKVLNNSHEDRQFACADCNKSWWARVPFHKQVSKCWNCRRKFNPVPREHEWGIGEFECHCGRIFKGWGIMGRTKSKCRRCHSEVCIARILPPKKRDGDIRPTSNTHNCNGINCYRRYCQSELNDEEKPPMCIHPKSSNTDLLTKIHWPSELHISTGSTLHTFLDQGSLETRIDSPAPSLRTIEEEEFE